MNLTRLLFHLFLGQRLPIVSGELVVPGLGKPVVIRRDGYGIAYIEAESDEDAWYGLGFCQGQDRAFQIESLLRVVRGTVAERAGAEGLSIDRVSRRVGFWEAARRQMEVLDPQVRSEIEAFARGI